LRTLIHTFREAEGKTNTSVKDPMHISMPRFVWLSWW